MVYVSISVINLKEAIAFYTEALRIFDYQGGSRLVCNSGIELILDLYEVGTEQHQAIFNASTHSYARISIHHGEHIKIKILKHLERLNVKHTFIGNIAGEFLELLDPSGNKIGIWAHHGGIL